VRWAGDGDELWFTRVEIFVDDDSGHLVGPTWDSLSTLLVHGDPADRGGHGTDQGTGMVSPVIGMVFSVAADTPGQASQTAVDVGTAALGEYGRGLYGVSVFPHKTAPAERTSDYPSLND
jgi:hypothetical protein